MQYLSKYTRLLQLSNPFKCPIARKKAKKKSKNERKKLEHLVQVS